MKNIISRCRFITYKVIKKFLERGEEYYVGNLGDEELLDRYLERYNGTDNEGMMQIRVMKREIDRRGLNKKLRERFLGEEINTSSVNRKFRVLN